MFFLKKHLSKFRFTLITTGVAIIVVVIGTVIIRFLPPNLLVKLTANPSYSPTQQTQNYPDANPLNLPTNLKMPSAKSEPNKQAFVTSQRAYGHFMYSQTNINQLMIISSYATAEYQRFEFLEPETGKALMKMIYAARDEGIWIVPVSGFRTIEQQEKLFYSQIQRYGSAQAAAKLSAPPGYSEHHTGYAIDLTDGNFVKDKIKDITYEFAKSEAYKWLNIHAEEFGFELSFPENNPQEISYEPWHWRFVGLPDARKVFAHAKLHSDIR